MDYKQEELNVLKKVKKNLYKLDDYKLICLHKTITRRIKQLEGGALK
jgi:hypothetical protein